MRNAAKKRTHINRGNILDDLGFSPEQATALKFKAELYRAILKVARNYAQKELQKILGEPEPRVSELLNGKIANKSVDNCCTMSAVSGSRQRPDSHKRTRKSSRTSLP